MRSHRAADCQTQEQRGNVDDLILRGFAQALDHARFPHQIAQHERGNQWGRLGDQNADGDGNNDGEHDQRKLGDGTRGVFHMRAPFFTSGQQAHNGRLNDGDQAHVRICHHGDDARHSRVGRQALRGRILHQQLIGDVNARGTINGANNADAGGFG
ncbi:MAG: hypothetical protein BWY63_01235 [Chloroflexi bacterium ADurb.Bin360]|nr:MAG: hypothetical protein BWY63_01235 [Chloroflexi bacterium ADurb.Bin360]